MNKHPNEETLKNPLSDEDLKDVAGGTGEPTHRLMNGMEEKQAVCPMPAPTPCPRPVRTETEA